MDPNYTITYDPGILTIGPAPLSITASNGTMTYGGTPPVIIPIYGGFRNGDGPTSLNPQPTCGTMDSSSTPAGTNLTGTSCSGAMDPNYTITYVNGSITVNPAPLTITANNQSMTYGGTVPTLTVSYSGFVNHDTSASLTTQPTITTTGTKSSPAGTYPIVPSGAVDPNYTISYVNGTLTIGQASLVITANSYSVAYGAAIPAITVKSYVSFVNGDTTASLTTQPSCSTSATSASPAGTYASTCSGAADPNYNITYVNGVVTITAAWTPSSPIISVPGCSTGFSVTISDGTVGATYKVAPTSTLPPGLGFSSSGVLSGSATKAGSYDVTFEAVGPSTTVTKTYELQVAACG
jgi:hypothetical protein